MSFATVCEFFQGLCTFERCDVHGQPESFGRLVTSDRDWVADWTVPSFTSSLHVISSCFPPQEEDMTRPQDVWYGPDVWWRRCRSKLNINQEHQGGGASFKHIKCSRLSGVNTLSPDSCFLFFFQVCWTCRQWPWGSFWGVLSWGGTNWAWSQELSCLWPPPSWATSSYCCCLAPSVIIYLWLGSPCRTTGQRRDKPQNGYTQKQLLSSCFFQSEQFAPCRSKSASYNRGTLFSECNSDCSCSAEDWDPVCAASGITYISPCMAGCLSSSGHGKNTVG